MTASRTRALGLGLLLAWALPVDPAVAQIVDVQSALGSEEGLTGEAQLTGEMLRGNSDAHSLGAALTVRRLRGANHSLLTLSSDVGATGGTLYRNHHFGHLRHRRSVGGPWSVEAFLQAELDEFRRLELRALAGAGVRLAPGSGDTGAGPGSEPGSDGSNPAVGLAVMVEREELEGVPTGSTFVRASLYATGAQTLATGWTVSGTTYAQPAFDDLADVRLSSNTGLRVQPGDRLSLELAFQVHHDPAPPAGVRGTDYAFRQSLVLDF